jgi:hypothetical protein
MNEGHMMPGKSWIAKAVMLLVLAVIWLFAAAAILFLTLPLWGMSIDRPLPWLFGPGLALWALSYVVLAAAIIRAKDLD